MLGWRMLVGLRANAEARVLHICAIMTSAMRWPAATCAVSVLLLITSCTAGLSVSAAASPPSNFCERPSANSYLAQLAALAPLHEPPVGALPFAPSISL